VILAGVAVCLALVAEMPHEKLKEREARSVANVRRANDTLIIFGSLICQRVTSEIWARAND
jgi:hypothetical protein